MKGEHRAFTAALQYPNNAAPLLSCNKIRVITPHGLSAFPTQHLMHTAVDPRLATLMMGIAARDEIALRQLFKLALPQVHAVARTILRSTEDANEVVVDVFQFVWVSAGRFDEHRGSVMGWLSVIARRRAIDRLRQRPATVSLDDEVSCRVRASLTSPTLDPLQDVQLFQEGCTVHAALLALSPIRRKLILLAFFEGYTHVEISKAVDMPLGTVKSHLRRALESMRNSIDAHNLLHLRGIDSDPLRSSP